MLADICRIAGLNLICLAAFSAPLVGWAEGDSREGIRPQAEEKLVRDVTTHDPLVQDLYNVLNEPIAVPHRVKKLEKSLSKIAEAHKVVIVVRESGMRPELPSDDRLSAIELRGRTVGEALAELLDPYGLDYFVGGVGIEIDAAETVRQRVEIRAYDVEALLAQGITMSEVTRVMPYGVLSQEHPRPIVMGNQMIVALSKVEHARVLEYLRKSTPASIRATLAPFGQLVPRNAHAPRGLTSRENRSVHVRSLFSNSGDRDVSAVGR